MPTIISAADACAVLLSAEPIFDIALPSKFYEYLACCKPIIGVCRGELAEVIKSSDIGFTVASGDIQNLVSVIKYLKNSPDLVQIMQKNSYNTLQRFSLDNISINLANALKEYNEL